MHDSFCKILPTYTHTPKTVFTSALSHIVHPEYKLKQDEPEKPVTDIDLKYFHKMDEIKTYKESMYNLGQWAPQNRHGK